MIRAFLVDESPSDKLRSFCLIRAPWVDEDPSGYSWLQLALDREVVIMTAIRGAQIFQE